ncbi:hypothetical protein T484DRAFT_2899498 [Baffinella frigidus]|nr:hypothetical protein T484DRAFT_2899498 [Cryptophyta sp. CCMP2293]
MYFPRLLAVSAILCAGLPLSDAFSPSLPTSTAGLARSFRSAHAQRSAPRLPPRMSGDTPPRMSGDIPKAKSNAVAANRLQWGIGFEDAEGIEFEGGKAPEVFGRFSKHSPTR